MGMFSALETVLSAKLQNFMQIYINQFADNILVLIKMGVPILILYYGYSILSTRGSNATIHEMLFNLVRIAIIFSFLDSSGELLKLSGGFIDDLKTGFTGKTSIWTLLDEQFEVAQQLAHDLYVADADYVKLRGAIACVVVWFGTSLVMATAVIVFIANEVSLTLLMVTAPIFIGCLTYGFTKELFNGWMRSIFSSVITLIFAGLIVRMGIDLNGELIAKLATNPNSSNLMTIGISVALMSVIICSLILVAARTAGNIAGVASSSAIQSGMVVAGMVAAKYAYGLGGSYASHIFKGSKAGITELANRIKINNAGSESTNSAKLASASRKDAFNRAKND